MTRELYWSTVPSATDPTATLYHGDVERWIEWIDREYGNSKDGLAFCAGVFIDNHRKKANLDRVDFLMLDFDEAEGKVADIVAPLMHWLFFAYSTHSHGVEGKWSLDRPRFRVILPLTRSVSVDEYSILWEVVSDLVGNGADRAASDASRLMYLPRTTAPGAKVRAWRKANRADALLDPDELGVGEKVAQLAIDRQRAAERARLKREARAADPDSSHWVESALFSIDPSDYATWRDCACAMKHGEASGDLTNGRALWEEWSRTSDKYDESAADKLWLSIDAIGSSKTITLGTVWALAEQAGWTPPRPPDKLDIEKALSNWDVVREPAVKPDQSGEPDKLEAKPDELNAQPDKLDPYRSPLAAKNDRYLVETALDELGFREGRIAHDGNHWIRYDQARGIYLRERDTVYRHVFRHWHLRDIVPARDEDEPKPFIAQDRTCATIERAAKIMAYIPDPLAAPVAGLAFANGFLDSDTGELVEHSPRHRAQVAYAFAYDPAHDEAPEWDAFMRSTFEGVVEEDSKIQLVEEYLGVCLLGRATEFEAVLFLLGEGMNGKSTLIKAVSNAFPDQSTSKVSPHHIGERQSHAMNSIAQLEGKLLNVVLDLRKNEMHDMGDFKAIVSGDPVQARRMREDPFWFRPRCGHVFATNDLPHVSDSSDGFWRRARAIDFEHQVTEETADRMLGSRLAKERRGIVHRLIRRGLEAIERGRLIHVASVADRTHVWRYESTPLRLFLEDEAASMTPDHKRRVKSAELYRAYKVWSDTNGFKAYNVTNFGRELARLGVRKEKSGTVMYYVDEWCDEHVADRADRRVEVPF